jgi:hypothetical protein
MLKLVKIISFNMYLKTRSFIYLKLSGNSNGANSMFIFVGVTLTNQLFRHFCINKMEIMILKKILAKTMASLDKMRPKLP